MGLLSNRVAKGSLKPGDHIYCWRNAYIYAHHGIYVGDDKVIHFTRSGHEVGTETMLDRLVVSSAPAPLQQPCEICTPRKENSGVLCSCLNCFLSGGDLYRFEYSVNPALFLAKTRGGTCTLAVADEDDLVVHRAKYLLDNGFGSYSIFKNNCEDFAIYCKTGLLVELDERKIGKSGQAVSIIGGPLAAVLSTPMRLVTTNMYGMVAVAIGVYCTSRYSADIGMRKDVEKVSLEELTRRLDSQMSAPLIEAPVSQISAPQLRALASRLSSPKLQAAVSQISAPLLQAASQISSFLVREPALSRLSTIMVRSDSEIPKEINSVPHSGGSSNKSDASKSEVPDPYSNPYFTHPTDHSSLTLHNKVLNGDNYPAWRRATVLALSTKNKMGFVDGTIEIPAEGSKKLAAWRCCNNLVHSWIINTLNSEISDTVIYYSTAKEIWDDLKDTFSEGSRIYQIRQSINTLRQEQLTIAAYYTKLKELWDELDSYTNSVPDDEDRMMQFFMGLNGTYSATRDQLLNMKPLPTTREAYSVVSQEEQRRAISGTSAEAESDGGAARAVRTGGGRGGRGFNNGGRGFNGGSDRGGFHGGHRGGRNFGGDRSYSDVRRYDAGQRRFGSERRRPFCTHCNEKGHWVQTCYQLHGDRSYSDVRRFDAGQRRFGTEKRRPLCTHCNEKGHWVQTCYELHGYPVGHPKARNRAANPQFCSRKNNSLHGSIMMMDPVSKLIL